MNTLDEKTAKAYMLDAIGSGWARSSSIKLSHKTKDHIYIYYTNGIGHFIDKFRHSPLHKMGFYAVATPEEAIAIYMSALAEDNGECIGVH